MRRREFITVLGGAATVWPLMARAQQAERVQRLGVLSGSAANDPDNNVRIAAFVQALQQLGWTDGQNVRIDFRWAAGNAQDYRKYAAELAALAPPRSPQAASRQICQLSSFSASTWRRAE